MYRKILAAVNEFTNSEIAARYAIALAGSCQAKLSLIFVARDDMGPDVIRRGESALKRLFMDARSAGVWVESVMEKGDPLKEIIRQVAEHGVDLVFTATRREDVKKRFFVKTLARELMVKLPCSVVMVRVVRMEKAAPGNILVPLRGGRAFLEERAFFVSRLAQAFSSKVTLFHLPEPITKFFHGEVALEPEQREKRIPADVHEFAEFLAGSRIPYERKTARGEVARTITAEAAARKNDLVVMGASQRSLLRTLIKGDPVESVLRETPCNLMIFKPGHEHPMPRKG